MYILNFCWHYPIVTDVSKYCTESSVSKTPSESKSESCVPETITVFGLSFILEIKKPCDWTFPWMIPIWYNQNLHIFFSRLPVFKILNEKKDATCYQKSCQQIIITDF